MPGTFALIIWGYIFILFRRLFQCGTDEFQKLGFLKKINFIWSLIHCVEELETLGGSELENKLESIVENYKKYFNLKESFPIMGICLEETKRKIKDFKEKEKERQQLKEQKEKKAKDQERKEKLEYERRLASLGTQTLKKLEQDQLSKKLHCQRVIEQLEKNYNKI